MGRLAVVLWATFFAQSLAAQTLTVSAAASLQEAFTAIGRSFEAANPGLRIAFNFGSSDVLATQIEKGAPVDVFAAADEQAMRRVAALIDPATRGDFAANALVLVVGAAPPPAVLADLRDARFGRIAIGSPKTVPAGRYAMQALELASVWQALEPRLVYAQNVRQVLDYVARGEADAGFVYATDAAIMPGKVRIAFDVPTATPVRYPIASLRDSKAPQAAQAFVRYVRGEEGQRVLRSYGFRAP